MGTASPTAHTITPERVTPWQDQPSGQSRSFAHVGVQTNGPGLPVQKPVRQSKSERQLAPNSASPRERLQPSTKSAARREKCVKRLEVWVIDMIL